MSNAATPVRLHSTPRYSEAVIHNGTVYLSGQVPEDGSADMRVQTESVLGCIDRLLGEAGSSRSQLLSAQIFLRDLADYDLLNEVWDAWLPAGCAPTRATVQAALADPAWRVEIVVVAAVGVGPG